MNHMNHAPTNYTDEMVDDNIVKHRQKLYDHEIMDGTIQFEPPTPQPLSRACLAQSVTSSK